METSTATCSATGFVLVIGHKDTETGAGANGEMLARCPFCHFWFRPEWAESEEGITSCTVPEHVVGIE